MCVVLRQWLILPDIFGFVEMFIVSPLNIYLTDIVLDLDYKNSKPEVLNLSSKRVHISLSFFRCRVVRDFQIDFNRAVAMAEVAELDMLISGLTSGSTSTSGAGCTVHSTSGVKHRHYKESRVSATIFLHKHFYF